MQVKIGGLQRSMTKSMRRSTARQRSGGDAIKMSAGLWADLQNANFEHESRVGLQTLNLDVLKWYHQQFNNIHVLSGLLLGFTTNVWRPTTFRDLISLDRAHCLFKDDLALVIGSFFFFFSTLAVGTCVSLSAALSIIKNRSADSALEIHTAATVARTRLLVQASYQWLFAATVFFLVSQLLSVVIYIGEGADRPYFGMSAAHLEEYHRSGKLPGGVTALDDGTFVIVCQDPASASVRAASAYRAA